MMLVFPQLQTGAGGQFPIIRRRTLTTMGNTLADGSRIVYADGPLRANAWDLTLRDLSDNECAAIQQLFESVEGRKGTFTFLDPVSNLLAHSEELDGSCWTKDPMLQITTGIDDPMGGHRAIRLINAGQTGQSLTQSLAAPAWFGYSMSVYARSDAASPLSLVRSSPTNTQMRVFTTGPGWTRCAVSGALNATESTVAFALQLPAGASVDLFGIQVEAQPGASAYKASGAHNGVYSHARFDHDMLRSVCDGPDQNRLDIRIVARD